MIQAILDKLTIAGGVLRVRAILAGGTTAGVLFMFVREIEVPNEKEGQQ